MERRPRKLSTDRFGVFILSEQYLDELSKSQQGLVLQGKKKKDKCLEKLSPINL